MKLKHRLFAILAALLILSAFAGCAKKGGADSGRLSSLRIGFFPNVTHAQALYMKNAQILEQAFDGELAVEWKEFNAGPAEIEAMFAGEVDIGYIGPIPAINAYIKSSGDINVIAGAANAGAILVTRPDLQLKSPSELSGLKVAVPQFGNTQHISLLNILRENGLQTIDKGGTVEVVQAANADIKTLLDTSRVDAALVPEPWGARLINEIGANMLFDEKQIWKNGDYPVAVVIVSREFAEKHPDIVSRFLQLHGETTQTINSDLPAAEKIINDELLRLTQKALEPDVLSQSFGRIGITSDIDENVMEEFAALLENEGFIDRGGDITGLVKRSQ